MNGDANEYMREIVDCIYRTESRRVFVTLIRPLGDFDVAEEALHDAFRAALEQWPDAGVPNHSRAWVTSTCGRSARSGKRSPRKCSNTITSLKARNR